ncbi:MAG TPA: FAD-dependent monooxygenase [Amycolatopsis sp.]|uniref:FAD-dependent monooxygenase n=1 Tax=Amycolatopsis sp. TaxID=37632 RepID=UPI002B468B45|nr:FAD-dependent monooxygenase [Amycolatopsis sp.]HKS47640.1 FAD-dependent monooxygenase [Amycolatopsis sp.]
MSGTAIIVGAGIGGLTAALALQRKGWQVDIYEQAPTIRPVGAAVGMAPNAVKALRYVGVGEDLRERGRRQEGIEIRVPSGRSLMMIPAFGIERRYGAPFYSIHRADLHDLLLHRVGVTALRTEHRATGITTHADSATVTFETPEGTTSATADLVVVADGIKSRLRPELFPGHPGPDSAGYTVWRGIVPAADAPDISPVVSVTWGRGARFGIDAINDGQVYWFACENLADADKHEHGLDPLVARFRRWHDPIPQLLASTPAEVLGRHDVYYLRTAMLSFVRDRVALIGDAAHAVTPDIGQGACLAIEDAVVLADAIEEHGVDRGLRTYNAIRRPRTESMSRVSGRVGGFMQNPVLSPVRDAMAFATPTSVFTRAMSAAYGWTPAAR